MGFDLRYPKITGTTEREQMAQMKSFLHQHVEQLQWVLNNITSNSNNVVVTPSANALSLSPNARSSSPAPSAESTFNSIKALIIKSAEIVEAYSEEINKRYASEYVAVSDFGTFREQTIHDIEENSTEIDDVFTNVQEIITDIENIDFTLLEVNAHIRRGLLYTDTDGVPVYGLEIGQMNTIDGEKVFDKFARFTADRLSFYDQNGNEVAYISDYKLHITHVEITGTATLGAFRLDTSNGFRLKWVGRG